MIWTSMLRWDHDFEECVIDNNIAVMHGYHGTFFSLLVKLISPKHPSAPRTTPLSNVPVTPQQNSV